MSQYIDKHIIAGLIDAHGNVHWEDIDNTPIADVVEVVRCKDCIHKEQAYKQGWEDGRRELKEEQWEDGRDRLD